MALDRLRRQGFTPRFICDVGAYRGEFARECMRVWSGTRIAAFEPQSGPAADLDMLASGHKPGMSVHRVLLGANPLEHVTLHEAETASSVLVEHHDQQHGLGYHRMQTLDGVVRDEFKGESPDFLKLDVQGYELEVLKGAEQTLKGVRMILAEVNLIDIHKGVPLLSELVAWLNERGFVAFDVCGLARRPLDDALWQIDMIFVRSADPLRADKRWGR